MGSLWAILLLQGAIQCTDDISPISDDFQVGSGASALAPTASKAVTAADGSAPSKTVMVADQNNTQYANHYATQPYDLARAATRDPRDQDRMVAIYDPGPAATRAPQAQDRKVAVELNAVTRAPHQLHQQNNCFLCKDRYYALLHVEGKSTTSPQPSWHNYILPHWCYALLRAEGKSATNMQRQLLTVSGQPHADAVPKTDEVAGRAANTEALDDALYTMLGFMMASMLWHMMPNYHNPAEASARVPPRWSPELEATYSFRTYAQDTLIWCITTDMQPAQQCAAIIQRLGGAARDLARAMQPNEMMNGGQVNGVRVDPVTLLFNGLQERFAPLQEESRLAALTTFMTFTRRPNERINELLTRFETVQQRAENEAGFNMSYEGLSYTLLRIVGISDSQLLQLLAPLNGQFPSTQQEYTSLLSSMRRMGHILENQPGNIAQSLRGPAPSSGDRAPRSGHSATQARTFVGLESNDSVPTPGENLSWSGLNWAPSWAQSYLGGGSETVQVEDSPYNLVPSESGSDTDTESDNYEEMDFSEFNSLPEEQRGEAIYWAYAQSKAKWRRFAHKPTRKVRHFVRRKGGGKGKGGKSASSFMASTETQAYFKGKGKRMGKSSNKGFGGRRGNPKDKDGRPFSPEEYRDGFREALRNAKATWNRMDRTMKDRFDMEDEL